MKLEGGGGEEGYGEEGEGGVAPDGWVRRGDAEEDRHGCQCVSGHEGVEEGGEEDGESAEDGVTRALVGCGGGVECCDEGQEGEGGGEAPGGDVGVHEHEGGAGDGEGDPGGEEGGGGGAGGDGWGGAGEEHPGGSEGEPDGGQVEEEEDPGEAEVRGAGEGRDGGGEDGEAEVFGDELGPGGVEGGVEEFLDACDVEAAVLDVGVEAVDEEDVEGEKGDDESGVVVFL